MWGRGKHNQKQFESAKTPRNLPKWHRLQGCMQNAIIWFVAVCESPFMANFLSFLFTYHPFTYLYLSSNPAPLWMMFPMTDAFRDTDRFAERTPTWASKALHWPEAVSFKRRWQCNGWYIWSSCRLCTVTSSSTLPSNHEAALWMLLLNRLSILTWTAMWKLYGDNGFDAFNQDTDTCNLTGRNQEWKTNNVSTYNFYKYIQASDACARAPSSSQAARVAEVALGGGCKSGTWESTHHHRMLSDSFRGAAWLHAPKPVVWHAHPCLCVAASRALHSNEQMNAWPAWHSRRGSDELLQEQSCAGLDTTSSIH